MPRMIRKQLYLADEQDRLLKRLAAERGLSEAEVVRQAVAHYAAAPPPDAAGVWEREVAFMRGRAPLGGRGAQARDWTRAGLYDQRLRRHGRRSG